MTGRHPIIRRVVAVSRVFFDIIYSNRSFSQKSRTQKIGRPRHREMRERLARNARHRVEHIGRTFFVNDVVKKRPELGIGQIGRGIRYRLNQILLIQFRREKPPDTVDGFDDFGLFLKTFFDLPAAGDVAHDLGGTDDFPVLGFDRRY